MSATTEELNANQLAHLAGCYSPDGPDSPGAAFLLQVQDAYRDAVEEEWFDEDDSPHEIADNAVPVYTHARWQAFVDLGAYEEDPSELGADSDDMTQAAAVCLYMIAERLVHALASEDA